MDILFPVSDLVTSADVDWWTANNEDHFKAIDALLPGTLKILPTTDSITELVRKAALHPVYQDRNVICVWMPPKPPLIPPHPNP